MATACWAFIVAKSTALETAPLLDFSSLQGANIEIHPQVIHKSMWTAWGYFLVLLLVAEFDKKDCAGGRHSILIRRQSVTNVTM